MESGAEHGTERRSGGLAGDQVDGERSAALQTAPVALLGRNANISAAKLDLICREAGRESDWLMIRIVS